MMVVYSINKDDHGVWTKRITFSRHEQEADGLPAEAIIATDFTGVWWAGDYYLATAESACARLRVTVNDAEAQMVSATVAIEPVYMSIRGKLVTVKGGVFSSGDSLRRGLQYKVYKEALKALVRVQQIYARPAGREAVLRAANIIRQADYAQV
jgi:hypothetical protein